MVYLLVMQLYHKHKHTNAFIYYTCYKTGLWISFKRKITRRQSIVKENFFTSPEDQTSDPLIINPMLSLLSYSVRPIATVRPIASIVSHVLESVRAYFTYHIIINVLFRYKDTTFSSCYQWYDAWSFVKLT